MDKPTVKFTISAKIPSFRKPEIDFWIAKNQGQHKCGCGCGTVIKILRRHYWKGVPQYIFKHKTTKESHYVHQYWKKGFMTVDAVCKRLGIGNTTLRRYEGKLYPVPKKLGKIRFFTEKDYELIKRNFLKHKPTLRHGKNEYMTSGELCKRFGFSFNTYRRYEGNLFPKAKKIGGKRVISRADYEKITRILLKKKPNLIKNHEEIWNDGGRFKSIRKDAKKSK